MLTSEIREFKCEQNVNMCCDVSVTDRWMNKWMNGWMDKQTDGRMDGNMFSLLH